MSALRALAHLGWAWLTPASTNPEQLETLARQVLVQLTGTEELTVWAFDAELNVVPLIHTFCC